MDNLPERKRTKEAKKIRAKRYRLHKSVRVFCRCISRSKTVTISENKIAELLPNQKKCLDQLIYFGYNIQI